MKLQTACVQGIDPSKGETWENKFFLTFDMDWASDAIIQYTVDFVERYDLHATWFITHQTDVLHRLRENPKFELGIHPNLNGFLDGESTQSAERSITDLLEMTRGAVSERSHCLFMSSRLQLLLKKHGITRHGNYFIPKKTPSHELRIAPWKDPLGLVVFPHFYEDDLTFFEPNTPFPAFQKNLEVVSFHPIHIALNSENLQRYIQAKPMLTTCENLDDLPINTENCGVRTQFEQLLQMLC